MSSIENSKLLVKREYFFKCEKASLPDYVKEILSEIKNALEEVKIDKYKKSSERSRKKLFSPVCLNLSIKEKLKNKGMLPVEGRKLICDYRSMNETLNKDMEIISSFYNVFNSGSEFSKDEFKRQYDDLDKNLLTSDIDLNSFAASWKRLTNGFVNHLSKQKNKIIIKSKQKYKFNNESNAEEFIEYISRDFVGFREIDFLKNKVGVEVQFGKYAFMVYNVCAKMKIFEKAEIINFGIEIVPTKKMQKVMSTGVSFFEQFVWDLDNRGSFSEDVPVVILGIEPNQEGFLALSELGEEDECSISKADFQK